MGNIVTTDLSKFGTRELKMVRDFIDVMLKNGLPRDFENDEVQFALNTNLGWVFLTNKECQVAILDSNSELISFYQRQLGW